MDVVRSHGQLENIIKVQTAVLEKTENSYGLIQGLIITRQSLQENAEFFVIVAG